MIDEKKLIEDIEKEFDGVCTYDVSPSRAVQDFTDIVDRQPKVGVWIPVSERLPNNLEHDWVLAQVQEDNGYMWIPKVMEYRESKDDWFYDGEYGGWLKEMHGDEYRVIAWQPLPEPYKAGDE